MARISTYGIDGTPVSSDKLIGTDSSGTTTKNYPLGSVSDWLKESGASAVLGQNNYSFQIALDPDAGRLPGSFSFENYGGDGTEFINVSRLTISKSSSTGKYVGDYLLSTVGDRVMLGQLDDLNSFGVYTLVSLVQNSIEPTFYDAELLFVEGNGALQGNKSYGLATYSASASAGSAVWGSIEGTVTNQTDLVDYIDAEIAAIPTPATPTLQSVTDEGNTTTNAISAGTITANNELHLVDSAMRIFRSSNDMRFRTNNSDNMTITSAGNVGIGITAPSAKLHVRGDNNQSTTGVLDIGTSGTSLRLGGNTTYSWIQTHSSKPLYINELGNNVILNGYGGTVGIGTTAPVSNYKLHVAGTGRPALFDSTNAVSIVKITNSGTGNGSYNGLDITINSTSSSNISSHGMPLIINTGDTNGVQTTERMRITSDGNVGIGTTAPSEKLEVAGNVKVSNGTGNISIIPNNNNSSISITSQSVQGALVSAVSDGFTFASRAIYTGVNIGSFNGAGTVTLGAFGYGNVNYQTAHNSFAHTWYGSRASNPWMTLNSTGLGIGTTAPGYLLHIVASNDSTVLGLDAGSNARFRFAGNSTSGYTSTFNIDDIGLDIGHDSTARSLNLKTGNQDRLTILGSGNVGIGTTAPDSKLTVAQSADSNGIKIIGFDDRSADNLNIHINSSGSGEILSNTGLRVNSLSGPTSFLYNGSLMLQIASTSVNVRDDVELAFGNDKDYSIGYNTADDTFRIVDGSDLTSNTRLLINPTGNVGIGTTAPAYKLDVNGIARVGASGASGQLYIKGFPGNGQYLYLDDGEVVWAMVGGTNYSIQSNGTSRLTATAGGKVGIGTTAPSGKLHITTDSINNQYGVYIDKPAGIAGNLFYAAEAGGSNYQLGGSSNFKLGYGNTFTFQATGTGGAIRDALKINVDSTLSYPHLVMQEDGGNVGIGTTAPTEKLEVAPDTDESAVIGRAHIGNVNFTDYAGFSHVDLNTTSTGYALLQSSVGDTFLNSQTGRNTHFRIGNSTKMILTSLGNVGIGTTAPAYKLDVVGDIASQGIYVDRTHESDGIGSPFATLGLHRFYGNANTLYIGKSNVSGTYIALVTQNADLELASTNGRVYLRSAGQQLLAQEDALSLGIIQHNAANNNYGKYISVTNSTNATGVRGRVDINGDLRIVDYSTSSPIEKTKIKNDGSAYFSGNVGIGTTAPDSKLHVKATSGIAFKVDPNDADKEWYIDTTNPDHLKKEGSLILNADPTNVHTSTKISFNIDGSNKASINSDGDLGVGTTAQTSKVHVNGTAMRQLRIGTAGGPSSNTDTSGAEGDIAYDDLYLYIKTGSGWGRVALDFGF